jgi:methylmalonyl-CoA decarboxylase subunit alpha
MEPAPAPLETPPSATLAARARLERLVDPGSFVEHFAATTQAVIAGTGTVDGRTVAVIANDPGAPAAWGPLWVEKTCRAQELARRLRCPMVYLFDASPPDTRNLRAVFAPRAGMGRIFFNHAQLSGQVPQVAAVLGPLSSVRAFPVAMCDAAVFVEGTTLSLTPAGVAGRLIGQKAAQGELGSARLHGEACGIGDAVVADDAAALAWCRRYLSLMPAHAGERPPPAPPRAPQAGAVPIEAIIPRDPHRPFAVRDFLDALVDGGSLLELKPAFGREVVTALARLEGRVVGIVASNSQHKGGILHPDGCDKAVRFIALCDAFEVPLLYLADVPGFMVGLEAERRGIVSKAARFFTASATARVVKISVVLRKVHTAGLYAMCGPAFEPDAFLALPGTEISVVGRKFVEASLREDVWGRALTGEARDRYQQEIRKNALSASDPRLLAQELVVDAVVPAGELRARLALLFERFVAARPVEPGRTGRTIWPI